MTRPSYPRIAHLAPGPGVSADDRVLSPADCRALLAGPVRVEEKFDGANVSFALDAGGAAVPATRGGLGATDRGSHLGRARAWAAERSGALRAVLTGDRTLYGEWLLTTHGVAYDGLPDLFVAFDLLEADGRWLGVAERDAAFDAAGLWRPAVLADLPHASLSELDALLGPSAFGHERVEGMLVRAIDPGPDVPRLAKRRTAGVPTATADAFRAGRRENRLARVRV